MKYLITVLGLLIVPTMALAQKPAKSVLPKAPHSDINLVADAYPADTLVEEDAVYVLATGATLIHLSAGDAFAVTDADGSDGEAAVTVPAGSFQVFARPTGKPKASATLNGQSFTRAKGKSAWLDVSSALPTSGDWTYETNGMGLSLRFYAPVAVTDSALVDSAQ